MFFALSKILAFLIKPLNWVLLLLIAQLFPRFRSKKWLWSTLLLFYIATNSILSGLAVRAWEYERVELAELNKEYDAVIVLGGYAGLAGDTEAYSEYITFNGSVDRLMKGILLWKKGYADKLMLSSGSGKLIGLRPPNSQMVAAYLNDIGIDSNELLIETSSRNTYENALFSAQILNNKYPDGRFLLVTSSFHMRRARGCFEKQGLNITPFPADFKGISFREFSPSWLLPSYHAIDNWQLLIKEIIGYNVYRIKAYI